ncbi:MAG: MauE/DoxX family redox-associated membrane protein [Acidimicrobiales bacterium]
MLTSLGDASAVLLGVFFATSAIAKWRDPVSTEASFQAFGLSRPRLLARVVPILELTTTIGLVMAPRFVSLVAIALLVAFTTVLIRGLRAGVKVGCGCFGSAGKQPLSSLDIVRNALFAALALSSALLSETGFANPSLASAIFVVGGAMASIGFFSLARARHGNQDVATRLNKQHRQKGHT